MLYQVINFKFTKLNTNAKLFKEFLIDTISKLDKQTKSTKLFVMNYHVSHVGKEITDLVTKSKNKILYSVTYELCFNPIELSFRHIKGTISFFSSAKWVLATN